MSHRYVVVAIVLLIALAPAAMAQKITADQVFALGLDPSQKAALDKGEIISSGFKELSDKELALIMAVMVPAPMDKVVAFSNSGANMKVDKDILAHGALEGDDVKGSLAGAKWEGTELSEIDKLVAVEPGSDFNLSAAEMERFAALHKKFGKGCSKDATCSKAVMDEYRSVMEGRLKAYQAGGLAAVKGYTRGSSSAEPSEEMKKATEAMTLAKQAYPEVYNAMLNYPKGDQSKIKSTFLWLKKTIQDRPTFVLSHRMLFQDKDLVFRVERQFYVGQSYNSLQTTIGLFPSGDKTTVFYLNRTSTDQVAGFMSSTRHGVGRKMMEKEVRKLFKNTLAAVSK